MFVNQKSKCIFFLLSMLSYLNLVYSSSIHISVVQPKISIEYFLKMIFFVETQKYIEIKNGTKLQLRCVSDKEIRWLFNREEYGYVSKFETKVISLNDTIKNKFIIDLIITNSEYSQTGEYSCIYNNIDDRTFIEDYYSVSDRVYLFVYDDEHLVATKTMFEVPSKSEEYFLKCLPTNPRINVTLYKDGELMTIDNDTLKFHPSLGFIIKDTILDYRRPNLFNCVFKFENKTDDLPFPFTISYVPLDNLSIKISGDSGNVVVYSTFTITCELTTRQVGKMDLSFSYPNANSIEPIKNHSTSHANDQITLINTFTFVNVTKNNEGQYSCSAANTTMKNTKALDVQVFDLNTTFTINITTDLPEPIIEENYGIDVLMAYTVTVWPTKGDFKLNCLRNGILLANSVMKSNRAIEMQTLPNGVDSRYEFLFESTNQLIVSIKNVSVNDSGIYTVSGQNSNSFANESITLIINGLPYIKSNYEDRFFELNNVYDFKFDIISFPLTNITFKRYLCSETECDPSGTEENNWISLFDQEFYKGFNFSLTKEQNYSIFNQDHNITIKSFDKPKYYRIVLKLLANQSSIFKCEVINDFGETSSQLPVLVSDAGPEGFELSILNTELIEDDNITVICKSTKLNYTRIFWTLIDEESLSPKKTDLENFIKNYETTHSLVSKLNFINAKKNMSGIYQCNAEYKDDQSDITYGPNYKQIELNIEKMLPPKIIKTNMERDLNVLKVYQTTAIDLYCEFTGRPKPSIEWRKNNILLNVTDEGGIEFSKDNQHLSIKRLVSEDSGKYECNVFNKGGYQRRLLGLKVENKNDNLIPVAGLAGIFTFMLIGCVFVVMAIFLGKRIREDRKQKQDLEMFTQKLFNFNQNIPFNPDLPLDEQIDLLPYDNKWEFPIEKLTFGPVLGQGAFGRVIKAEADGIDDFNYTTTVAVKMLKENADMDQRKALMTELKILIHLGRHLNIVNLLGAVTTNAIKGELLVILEYCEHGSLRQFLLNNRTNFINQVDPETGEIDTSILEKQDYNYANEEIINSMMQRQSSNDCNQSSNDCYLELRTGEQGRVSMKKVKRDTIDPITSTDLACYAFQISRGMEYLASRKLIHRDLAIRNVLLAEGNIVKICDFGLAKDCFLYDNYVKKNNGPLPVKWMAIESIADKIFTIKSDVWSFGVVLWELFTLGSNPYPGMEVDEEFYRKLKNGYRMEQPSYCPDGIYELMKVCWLENPNERLDFSEISKRLGSYLGENVTQHYIDLNLPYDETNQIMYLENQGYLQLDQINQITDEDYLEIPLNDENLGNRENNYVNQEINGQLNNEIKQDKIAIVDYKNTNHTYLNV